MGANKSNCLRDIFSCQEDSGVQRALPRQPQVMLFLCAAITVHYHVTMYSVERQVLSSKCDAIPVSREPTINCYDEEHGII